MTKEEEPTFEWLENFLYNCLIIISWISLSIWAISTGLMSDGIIPKVQDWSTWTYLIVPFNFFILMIWSYRVMILRKPCFCHISERKEID